jgi:hypothetical protein
MDVHEGEPLRQQGESHGTDGTNLGLFDAAGDDHQDQRQQ